MANYYMELIPLDKTSIKSQAVNYHRDAVVQFYLNELQRIVDRSIEQEDKIMFGFANMFMPCAGGKFYHEWADLYNDFQAYRKDVYPLLQF